MDAIRFSDTPKFSQDEAGQWWYRAAPGRSARKRARVRLCPVCGQSFLSADPRTRTCSHPCGAAAMHAARPSTTPRVTVGLRNADNPRYSQDDQGQWWYTPGGPRQHARTRAYVKTCAECGAPFVINIFHRKTAGHCSRECGQRAWAREHPGHYTGEKASNWKGGRRVVRGYVWVWDPEAAERMRPGTKKPYVLEHRLVMEQVLGRPLLATESVHHKNGIRHDNRPENLELWAKHQPPGQRPAEQRHCETCTCS